MAITAILCSMGMGSARAQTITISNLWSISTADGRSYVTSGTTERGIAYNPVTGDVLLVSRAAGLQVAILSADTGAELGFLDTTGISGGTFVLSLIGVADDGAIYGANLSTSTTAPNFTIYRWGSETDTPTVVYGPGDPGHGVVRRWGDAFNLRGSGTNTQMIASGSSSDLAALFTTTDGTNFTATTLTPSGISSTDLGKGLAFGTNNTFYGKRSGSTSVRNMSFDLGNGTNGTATLITNIPIDSAAVGISVDITNRLLAAVQTTNGAAPPHNLLVYDISTPTTPVLIGTVAFPTPGAANGNIVGGTDIGGGRIFAVDTGNGIVAAQIVVSQAAIPPSIVTDPAAQTVAEGGYVTFSASATGTKPLNYQWYFNVTNAIANATNSSLTLTNVQLSDAGGYSVTVTNAAGSTNSAAAVLTVNASTRSTVATPVWHLSPGDRPYLTSDNNQRGLAYNPATTNLVMVSRSISNAIYVLDSKTGAHLRTLNTDPTIISGGFFAVNMIGVADDGAVYACNLSLSENTLTIYRWDNDSSNSAPAIAYGPTDPVAGRWGDTMAVRGGGNNTQILLAARDGGMYALFTTADSGATFTSTTITVADAASDTFTLGLSFGQTNSFWTKISGGVLRHIEFDLAAGTGVSAQTFATTELAGNILPIGVDPGRGLLSGISLETPDNVRLYDIATLTNPPVNIDTDFFPTDNVNGNGTGSVAFGNNRLFVLDTNNGLLALDVQRTHGDFFPVRIELRESDVVLTWIGTWVLQSSTNLVDGFGDVNGATSPYTNSITSAPQMFFRLRN